MIKNLFKDISKYLPAQIIPAIVNIISIPIITRLFPPTIYGNYVLAMITIVNLSTLTGWISISVVRFYPSYEKEGKINEFVNLTIKLAFLSIFVVAVFSFCILILLKNSISEIVFRLMCIGIIVFILMAFFNILLDFLRIERRINWYSGFSIWKSITTVIFGLLLIKNFSMGMEGLLWGAVLSLTCVLPILWVKSIGKIKLQKNRDLYKESIEMAKYSFPLVIGNIAAWVLSVSDRYILQLFQGGYEVGIYSISYQISDQTMMLINSLFAFAFNPLSIIIWEKEGIEKSKEFLRKGTRYYLLLCIPAIVGISVLAGPILNIIATKDYLAGAKIIPLVVLGVFFLGLNQRFGVGLGFYKKTHLSMYILIISGLANIILNFIFIPRYGYIAAAFTTLISYALMLLLNIIISRHYFAWEFPFKTLLRATCASTIMGLIIYFINAKRTNPGIMGLFSNVCLGTVIYLIMLFLLQEFNKEEKEALKLHFKKLF